MLSLSHVKEKQRLAEKNPLTGYDEL